MSSSIDELLLDLPIKEEEIANSLQVKDEPFDTIFGEATNSEVSMFSVAVTKNESPKEMEELLTPPIIISLEKEEPLGTVTVSDAEAATATPELIVFDNGPKKNIFSGTDVIKIKSVPVNGKILSFQRPDVSISIEKGVEIKRQNKLKPISGKQSNNTSAAEGVVVQYEHLNSEVPNEPQMQMLVDSTKSKVSASPTFAISEKVIKLIPEVIDGQQQGNLKLVYSSPVTEMTKQEPHNEDFPTSPIIMSKVKEEPVDTILDKTKSPNRPLVPLFSTFEELIKTETTNWEECVATTDPSNFPTEESPDGMSAKVLPSKFIPDLTEGSPSGEQDGQVSILPSMQTKDYSETETELDILHRNLHFRLPGSSIQLIRQVRRKGCIKSLPKRTRQKIAQLITMSGYPLFQSELPSCFVAGCQNNRKTFDQWAYTNCDCLGNFNYCCNVCSRNPPFSFNYIPLPPSGWMKYLWWKLIGKKETGLNEIQICSVHFKQSNIAYTSIPTEHLPIENSERDEIVAEMNAFLERQKFYTEESSKMDYLNVQTPKSQTKAVVPLHCVVPGCPSLLLADPPCLYPFPGSSFKFLRQLWSDLVFCDASSLTDADGVCSKHFLQNTESLSSRLGLPTERLVLNDSKVKVLFEHALDIYHLSTSCASTSNPSRIVCRCILCGISEDVAERNEISLVFYPLPHFPQQRAAWLKVIDAQSFNDQPDRVFVCSRHFVGGSPSKNNLFYNYKPSLHLYESWSIINAHYVTTEIDDPVTSELRKQQWNTISCAKCNKVFTCRLELYRHTSQYCRRTPKRQPNNDGDETTMAVELGDFPMKKIKITGGHDGQVITYQKSNMKLQKESQNLCDSSL